MIDDVNEQNWLIYAAKAYEKPSIVQGEFEEDIARIQYIKRLLTKYYSSGNLKERLILNHLVIFYNVFGPIAGTRLLFFRMDQKDLESLKPFLIQLGTLPEIVKGINGKDVTTAEIKLDPIVIQALRKLT
jgi:hypothetical protein